MDQDVRKALADELAALCERIDKEFLACREDMTKLTEGKSEEGRAEMGEQKAELMRALADGSDETDRKMDKLQKATEKALKDFNEASEKQQQQREERQQRSESEIWLKLDRTNELLEDPKGTQRVWCGPRGARS